MLLGRCLAVGHRKTYKNISIRTLVTANVGAHENYTRAVKPFTEIPSPTSYPVLGHMPHFFPGGQFHGYNVLDIWRKLRDRYGPIVVLKVPTKPPNLFIFDPECAATVLHGENQYPFRGIPEFFKYYRRTFDKESVGDLIGEDWKRVRSMLNPIMMQSSNVKIYAEDMDEVALEMVERLKNLRDENNRMPGDLDHYINLWALESIGLVGIGQRLNCLDPNLPEDAPVKKLVNINEAFFKILYKLDIMPSLWRYFYTPTYFKGMRIINEMHSLSEHFVEKGIKDIENGKRQYADKKSMLEQMLELDRRMAHRMAVDMMIGGVSTVSSTVMFLLYLLAKNPEKQMKLREELARNPENTRYLVACFKESYRVMSTSPGNIRRSTKPYNLLGYEIPENTFILIAHAVMSTTEEHYHRALEYIPERWLVGPEDPLYYGNTHPFARNTAFGFGSRTCVARRIAEMEMETLIKRIVKNFQVEWDGPDAQFVNDSAHHCMKRPHHFVFRNL